MAKASKRHNSEYRNFFYVLIIAKNIYSIKYLKKNRRAGKQLEKVLKSRADRVILRPCLAERWVITHETPLQAFANLGQLPSVWSGEAYHIENRQEKDKERLMEKNMTLDLDNMTRSEFDKLMTKIKDRHPNLFQFIIDFLDDKVTSEEVYDFLKMKRSYQVNYIKNYKARA